MKSRFQTYSGVFLLSVLIFTMDLNAQIQKRAQVGFRFLENPTNAQVVGRGGYGMTNLSTAASVFSNPAGLGWINKTIDFSVDYMLFIADINQSTIALSYKSKQFGVIAFSANVMDYGTFYGTRRAFNDKGYVETGTFSPHANAFGLAYAKAVSDRFAFGIHIKNAYQDLGNSFIAEADTSIRKKNYSLSVLAADVGTSYDFKNGITFGAAFDNVSKEIRYEDEEFPLPFAMKFGMTFDPGQFFDLGLTSSGLVFCVESYHGRDYGEKVRAGMEYEYLDTFIFRSGYMFNYSERGFTLGFGLRSNDIRFDYAYQDFGIFSGIHLVSVGYGLNL